MIFKTVEELIEQLKKDNASLNDIRWARTYNDLDTLIRECPPDFRLWVIKKGYEQFINCKFSGYTWCGILVKQPQFYIYCDWELLSNLDWEYLLKYRPEFAKYRNWDVLSGTDWAYLLSELPEYAEICDWSKLSDEDWRYLLKYRPQFRKFKYNQ